jgi:hypothetical protein
LVKLCGRELANLRVHPVLDRKHVNWVSAVLEALKQTSLKASFTLVFAHDRGRQLIWITNKDNSLWLKHQGMQGCQLRALTGLINDQVVNFRRLIKGVLEDVLQILVCSRR